MIHYSLAISVPELDVDTSHAGTRLVLKKALEAPWLLHEILAISARHLAFVKPENSASYLTQSIHLQTKAIEMFNSANLHINESNCISALLFSSTLGRHVLADMLANQDVDADMFVQQYIRYVRIHRGLRAIASGSWSFIVESELQPILARTTGLELKPIRGSELTGLRELITQSSSLDQSSSEACLQAIHYLQIGLDQFTDENPPLMKYQMVFIWSFMNPPPFTDLIRQHQPEALIILGHYAILLHHARSLWQIGTSGAFLFEAVSKLLPDVEWAKYLRWPRMIIEG